jgi:TetR/AcrR family transcriptional repressor of nem operon
MLDDIPTSWYVIGMNTKTMPGQRRRKAAKSAGATVAEATKRRLTRSAAELQASSNERSNGAKPSARDKLLEAAMHVVRAKGYAAATVDDICKEAGVTKGAFFHHFESKEDLGVAAAQYWSDITTALFESAPYQDLTDPLQRLLGYVDFRREILRGNLEDFTCLLGTMVQEAYETSPRIREACDASISRHAEVVAKDIAQAKELYAPDAPWSAEDLANFTQVVVQGSFVLAKAKHGAQPAKAALLHLKRYVEFLFGKTGN